MKTQFKATMKSLDLSQHTIVLRDSTGGGGAQLFPHYAERRYSPDTRFPSLYVYTFIYMPQIYIYKNISALEGRILKFVVELPSSLKLRNF